jgi:hypothetical protein
MSEKWMKNERGDIHMALSREHETRLDQLRGRVLDGTFTVEEQIELERLMQQRSETSYDDDAPTLHEILHAVQVENEELAALLKRLMSS